MQYAIAPTITAAADAVRSAVASVYAADEAEAVANEAVSSGSPVVAVAEGMRALWARVADLDTDGVDALAGAAHYVAEAAFWGRAGEAAAILVALATAGDVESVTGGPDVDPRFAPADPPS